MSEKRGNGVKCVALTFDDGPNKECTKDLLDGLKARGVKATFFLMGQSIPGNEDLVRRMKDEGHLIDVYKRQMPASMKGATGNLGVVNESYEKYADSRVFPKFDREYLPNGMWSTMKTVGSALIAGDVDAVSYTHLSALPEAATPPAVFLPAPNAGR